MSRKRTHDHGRGTRRSGGHRRRTISVCFDTRGQTTQDFAIGIGIFLLAIAFVFSFLPSVITPFDSSVGGAETAQADRIADLLVHNLSTPNESANRINESDFDARYSNADLSTELGLRASDSGDAVYDHVNVTVETFQGEDVNTSTLSGGDVYDNQSAASAARIVTIEGDPAECDPACRLVVRVW
ncbi:DUF7287 family protein [Natrinema halophilum]|uniref:Pilin/flagellin n=1 Tax=Natrinema halophilum TaxID=1699371 RepID=A0A7D5KM44_9EURY|nr:hypothetical protein [Natrinema halophilum]QLG50538.1 hypothetical protein HYG82_17650 [Natrinema halophilum]